MRVGAGASIKRRTGRALIDTRAEAGAMPLRLRVCSLHPESSSIRGATIQSNDHGGWGMQRNRMRSGLRSAWLQACVAVTLVLPMLEAGAQTPSANPPATTDKTAEIPFLGGFLRETRIVYPLQLGEWKAVYEHLYEPQESGVSVRYMHGADADRWIDLYFYPAGVISPEQFDKIAGMEREELRQAHLQQGLPAPDIAALRRFSFDVPAHDGKREEKGGVATDFEYSVDGQTKSSAMTLMLENMYLIKGRFSAAAATLSRKQAADTLEALMAQLLPRVSIKSTGECWMPLPIERLKDGEVPPADKIWATYGKDGDAKVYLLGDRVLAADPASGAADVMMMLGMAKLGHLFPGCVEAGPEIPAVPAGMREIHLEYRVPIDESKPTDMPQLRSHKAGVS